MEEICRVGCSWMCCSLDSCIQLLGSTMRFLVISLWVEPVLILWLKWSTPVAILDNFSQALESWLISSRCPTPVA